MTICYGKMQTSDDLRVSPDYIHTVHHLIEKCLVFNMDREECVTTLEKYASIKPAITRTVWKELEKSNKEFFTAYNLRLETASSRSRMQENDFNQVLIEATKSLRQQKLDDS